MACQFSVPFNGDADALLAKARSAVQSQGGNFHGDESGGEFSVAVFGNRVAGSFTIAGQVMDIIITDKPFLVPCNAIESFLKSQLA